MSSRASVASPRCAFCTSRRSTSRATWRGAARRAGCCSNGRPTTSCRWRMTRRRWTEPWKRSPRRSEPWDDCAMRVIILGSAAGGGLPQWNCGCANCRAARDGGAARTQSSVAVSADGERWILLNASPDLRMQLAAHRSLWPRGARGTPIHAVILTDGEIDHTLGLLLLRESTAKRSEEHTSELQSPCNLVCRLLLEKKKIKSNTLQLLDLYRQVQIDGRHC